MRKKNSQFVFKKFTINQDKCAMKVCTDACIFGAYINPENATNILDIGAGTGLLSLMLAQRIKAKIHAIEIDENAYNQAIENVSLSNYKDQIIVSKNDIRTFVPENKSAFDLIISNPPFYQKSLQSPDNQANKAHHATSLTFDELIFSVKRLLTNTGKFMVLLPPFETHQLEKIANKTGLFASEKLFVKHSSHRNIFRIITTFEYSVNKTCLENHLEIYQNDEKTYSESFKNLLNDYYLIF